MFVNRVRNAFIPTGYRPEHIPKSFAAADMSEEVIDCWLDGLVENRHEFFVDSETPAGINPSLQEEEHRGRPRKRRFTASQDHMFASKRPRRDTELDLPYRLAESTEYNPNLVFNEQTILRHCPPREVRARNGCRVLPKASYCYFYVRHLLSIAIVSATMMIRRQR